MLDELSSKRVALSLALVTAVLSIICALLIAIAPEATLKLFGSIFHGLDITKIAKVISLESAVLGTVTISIIALIAGWLFAIIYNRLNN